MKNLICAVTGALLVGLCVPDRSYCDDGSSQCCREVRGSDLCSAVCVNNPWRGYVDTLFLGRGQQYSGDLVRQSGSPVTVALSGSDLDFDSATGVRAGFTRSLRCGRELELSFTGMGDWQAEGVTTGNNDLSLPGALGALADFSGTDAVETQYTSGMRSFEANLIEQKHGIDWLVGFRYLKLDEGFSLTTFDLDSFAGEYTIKTTNSLYGGQIGCRCERSLGSAVFSVAAKSGIYGNQADQASVVRTLNGTAVNRDIMKSDNVVSNISEITLNSDFALSECIGVRIGLDLLWAADLALAPNQLDFTDQTTSSDFVDTTGSVFMQGAHFGLVVDF